MSTADLFGTGRRYVERNPLESLFVAVLVVLLVDLVRSLLTGALPLARLLTFVWDGLIVGLVLGLAGIGLSLTYSILGFANFSHGDVVTVGAFSGWTVTYVFVGLGSVEFGSLLLLGTGGDLYASDLGVAVLSTPAAVLVGLVAAAAATAALSLGVDRLVYRPLRDTGGLMLLIASVGVAFILRYTVVFFYTPTKRAVTVSPATAAVGFYEGIPVVATGGQALVRGETVYRLPVEVGSGTVSLLSVTTHEAALVVAAGALMLGVHLLLQRTKLGKAMRAMADNKDLARARGIPTERVIRWTWIVGSGLTGVAGYLIALERGTISFQLGWLLLLLIFAAVILGGIGSVYGAILGGLIIGVTSTVSLVWLPESTFARPAAFLIMILVLLVRPQGLFAGREIG